MPPTTSTSLSLHNNYDDSPANQQRVTPILTNTVPRTSVTASSVAYYHPYLLRNDPSKCNLISKKTSKQYNSANVHSAATSQTTLEVPRHLCEAAAMNTNRNHNLIRWLRETGVPMNDLHDMLSSYGDDDNDNILGGLGHNVTLPEFSGSGSMATDTRVRNTATSGYTSGDALDSSLRSHRDEIISLFGNGVE